jgi:putative redox protein
MRMELNWKGGLSFEASPPSGNRYVLEGNGEGGATPIEAFVASMVACSAMDVVSILLKMRQPVESYRVEVEWERGPKDVYPRPVVRINVRHIVGGGVDPEALQKAVRLSDEKYCGVTASLRTPPKIETSWSVEP